MRTEYTKAAPTNCFAAAAAFPVRRGVRGLGVSSKTDKDCYAAMTASLELGQRQYAHALAELIPDLQRNLHAFLVNHAAMLFELGVDMAAGKHVLEMLRRYEGSGKDFWEFVRWLEGYFDDVVIGIGGVKSLDDLGASTSPHRFEMANARIYAYRRFLVTAKGYLDELEFETVFPLD